MTLEQALAIGKEFDDIRRQVSELVNAAMPDEEFPVKPETKAAMRGLFVEGISAMIVQAGSLASISRHLEGIHEEMKKANSPAPLMRR
jgi:hypothetical protein